MEVQCFVTGNQVTLTGLMGISREDFNSVMRQALEKAPSAGAMFYFPEIGTRMGYREIAPEGAWGSVWDKIPSTLAPAHENLVEDVDTIGMSEFTRRMTEELGDLDSPERIRALEKRIEDRSRQQLDEFYRNFTPITRG